MKDKFLPWFLLFCALGLSGTAAYYSVVGLSIVFVGVALPVIIMGSFLEISKIALNYLGKSVEWLQINVPIAMKNAELLAKKVAVAAWPHLLMASDWTLQNKDFIIVGSVCFVAGAALNYLMQPKKAATV